MVFILAPRLFKSAIEACSSSRCHAENRCNPTSVFRRLVQMQFDPPQLVNHRPLTLLLYNAHGLLVEHSCLNTPDALEFGHHRRIWIDAVFADQKRD